MNKPIFLLILSEQCSACVNFKRKLLPELEKELDNDSRLTYQVLNFPDFKIEANPDLKFHPELKNGFVKFFPTLMLVPANLWNNHKSKLKAVVKHGDEENPKIDYSKAGIMSWINDTINKNPLFQGSERNMGPLSRPLEGGRYIVPTLGQFRNSKLDETEL